MRASVTPTGKVPSVFNCAKSGLREKGFHCVRFIFGEKPNLQLDMMIQ